MVREIAHARKQNPLSDLNKILQGGIDIPDVIIYVNFGEDWLRGLPFFIDFDRRPYNTAALPCECAMISIATTNCLAGQHYI